MLMKMRGAARIRTWKLIRFGGFASKAGEWDISFGRLGNANAFERGRQNVTGPQAGIG